MFPLWLHCRLWWIDVWVRTKLQLDDLMSKCSTQLHGVCLCRSGKRFSLNYHYSKNTLIMADTMHPGYSNVFECKHNRSFINETICIMFSLYVYSQMKSVICWMISCIPVLNRCGMPSFFIFLPNWVLF